MADATVHLEKEIANEDWAKGVGGNNSKWEKDLCNNQQVPEKGDLIMIENTKHLDVEMEVEGQKEREEEEEEDDDEEEEGKCLCEETGYGTKTSGECANFEISECASENFSTTCETKKFQKQPLNECTKPEENDAKQEACERNKADGEENVHYLSAEWIFLYDKDGIAYQNYYKRLVFLEEFNTIEGFFRSYKCFNPPSMIKEPYNLYLFKKGYKPTYENYPEGLTCIIKNLNYFRGQAADVMWEKMVLLAIGTEFNIPDLIGAQLCIRDKTIYYKIWIKKYSTYAKREIRWQLRKYMNLPQSTTILMKPLGFYHYNKQNKFPYSSSGRGMPYYFKGRNYGYYLKREDREKGESNIDKYDKYASYYHHSNIRYFSSKNGVKKTPPSSYYPLQTSIAKFSNSSETTDELKWLSGKADFERKRHKVIEGNEDEEAQAKKEEKENKEQDIEQVQKTDHLVIKRNVNPNYKYNKYTDHKTVAKGNAAETEVERRENNILRLMIEK